MSKPNLDEMMQDAGIPSAEEVLLDEIRKLKEKNYALTNALRNTRGELKQVRRDLQKRIKEDKKKSQKPHYKNGRRGSNFNG